MQKLEELPSYILLDFETTGFDPKISEIIEIGAVLVEGLEEKQKFQTLIKPRSPVPLVISQLTGITNDMLKAERSLEEILPEFLSFLADHPIVAHNSAMEESFLLEHVYKHAGAPSEIYNSIDPIALILPDQPSHSMESLRKWAGIDNNDAHRALKDCEDLLKLLVVVRKFLVEQRPAIAAIASRFIGEGWWWNWLLAISPLPSLEESLSQPELGDLRSMSEKDSEREIDWNNLVKPEQVHDALTKGPSGFQYRESQEQMAQEVRSALSQGHRIAIEAPTGTGKSVAYLLPGVLAAEASGAPLVVSTHSKSLQDQLLEKDAPIVRNMIGRPGLRASVVKGQENYLCKRKLHDISLGIDESDSIEERFSIAYLQALSASGRAMELDRVSNYLRRRFPPLDGLIDRVRSHFTTTKGPRCPFYRSCHFYDSARIAHQSDVVIANHALVFNWPKHLPMVRNIVFDEAHHLEDQITEAFTVRLDEESISSTLDRLSKKRGKRRIGDAAVIASMVKKLTLHAPYDENPDKLIEESVTETKEALTHLSVIIPASRGSDRDNSDGYEDTIDLKRNFPSRQSVMDSFKKLHKAISKAAGFFEAATEAAEGAFRTDPAYDSLATYAFRFNEFKDQLQVLLDEKRENCIRLLYWSPKENVWRFEIAPIEVAEYATAAFASKRSVVLTSATLSTGSSQTFITQRIGLELSKPLLVLPSPYKLEEQAVAFFPDDVDMPGTRGHLDSIIGFTEQVATLLGGRTLLLMTSNRRLRYAADTLRERLEKYGIMVFDSVSDRRAAEAFKANERALLIGSERYGEGLDIPGKALSCVIIEKINEAMTRSHLAEARKQKTRFALFDYDFPLRMIWLKQRVGRLIRSTTDTGAVVVFDPRYRGWSAGSRAHVDKALAPIPIRLAPREQILFQIDELLRE